MGNNKCNRNSRIPVGATRQSNHCAAVYLMNDPLFSLQVIQTLKILSGLDRVYLQNKHA